MKDIMKINKSLENRGIWWKGTSQQERFFNFLWPLLTVGWFTINEKCTYVCS